MSETPTAVESTMVPKLGAEALGTFLLVFVGAATAVTTTGNVATPLAFGLIYIVMAYAVGYLSGGHFNPAVSVGFAVGGRLSWRHAGLYAAAQVIGAFLAGLLLFLVLQGFEGFEAEGSMGQNFFGEENRVEFSAWAALLVEFLATLLLVSVFLAVTDDRHPNRAMAPVVIGLAIVTIYFATYGMTGGGANPARSIGPGLFAGGDAVLQLWLFILAPLLGALAAGAAYPAVFGRGAEPVAGSGLHLGQLRPRKEVVPEQQPEEWAQEHQWQTEYPGWRWDADRQEWVADPSTAPQQWAGQEQVHEQPAQDQYVAQEPAFETPAEQPQPEEPQPYADPADAATRQMPTRERPEDDQRF